MYLHSLHALHNTQFFKYKINFLTKKKHLKRYEKC